RGDRGREPAPVRARVPHVRASADGERLLSLPRAGDSGHAAPSERTDMTPTALLRGLFEAAIAASEAVRCVPPHLPAPPRGRTVVIGAGKAAAAMARAVEEHWTAPLSGVVATRYGHAVPCSRIEVIEAAHPVPDAAGRAAAARVLAAVQGLTAEDLVL